METKYEFEDLYEVVELYIRQGEVIPNKYDVITIEQHDEICFIEKEVQILDIIKKEIKNDELYITTKCKVI
ncbi:hypothetical protein [Clostridium sporogenes]|uniref:hypothetical protein n=1 Tax=Clostridium sporogenes TaxID=1509 RepID=UPI0013D3ACDE|nr:hypothetical protein [Clostridium sporogenes]NFH40880.1 hypothetical protein [Clostridium sporogenes]